MQLQFALEMGRIHQGDCLDRLKELDDTSVHLVFADPPFNIGYEYDEYHDRQSDDDYIAWSRQWIKEVYRVLKPDGTFWLAIGDEYAAELKVAAKLIGFTTRSWVVWYYTFGVNCKKKFSRSHVHLFHFVKDENNFTFNGDEPQVRVPSARALVYADKRANPAGRLPDDTWILRPQDLPEGFQPADDTWYFARVAGTFKERQGFHGCQMPEQLLGRIVRVSSNPGDIVLDPFAGSGTTLAVSKKLGRQWVGCELSEDYVRSANERLDAIREGDALDGSADPIASAPSTANGRKLEDVIGIDNSVGQAAPVTERAGLREIGCATQHQSTECVCSTENRRTVMAKRELRDAIHEAIVKAFYSTHDGFSTDWLLASPELQSAFHEACRDSGLIGEPANWNRSLLRIRKSGGFPREGKVRKIHFSPSEMDGFSFAAEIAWRTSSGKFIDASLDEIFCDPIKSSHFDRIAKRYAVEFDPAGCRWAALRLRKASKQLVDEMKQFHFVFRTRDFPRRAQKWDSCDFDRFAGQPGLYMLQSEERVPLFIDGTLDLGARLVRHAECSSFAKAIRHVSVIPPDELPGSEYQDGLKVDLVRRHDPLLNVNLVGLVEALAS